MKGGDSWGVAVIEEGVGGVGGVEMVVGLVFLLVVVEVRVMFL